MINNNKTDTQKTIETFLLEIEKIKNNFNQVNFNNFLISLNENDKKILMKNLQLCSQLTKNIFYLNVDLDNDKDKLNEFTEDLKLQEIGKICNSSTSFLMIIKRKMPRRNHTKIYSSYKKNISLAIEKHKESHEVKTFKKAKITFTHVYEFGTSKYQIRDNDNYNTSVSKQIIDALTETSVIRDDNGIDISIMHEARFGCSTCTIITVKKQ